MLSASTRLLSRATSTQPLSRFSSFFSSPSSSPLFLHPQRLCLPHPALRSFGTVASFKVAPTIVSAQDYPVQEFDSHEEYLAKKLLLTRRNKRELDTHNRLVGRGEKTAYTPPRDFASIKELREELTAIVDELSISTSDIFSNLTNKFTMLHRVCQQFNVQIPSTQLASITSLETLTGLLWELQQVRRKAEEKKLQRQEMLDNLPSNLTWN